MRILVLHAWTRGNLGDVMQTAVLLRRLRGLSPDVLDLAGRPVPPSPRCAEMLAPADRFVPDTVSWIASFLPRPLLGAARRLQAARGRARQLGEYDFVVSAPGPLLALHDRRMSSALFDLELARRAGARVILSSHSIGPLPPWAEEIIGDVDLIVAREPVTHAYLEELGLRAIPSADFAFLYPLGEALEGAPRPAYCPADYHAAFLRGNNLAAGAFALRDGVLRHGDRELMDLDGANLVLATTDLDRDARFHARLSRRLGVTAISCASVGELLAVVRGARSVLTDRYHPGVCAARLGVPFTILDNREAHKMGGLRSLAAGGDVEAIRTRARRGLEAIEAMLGSDRSVPSADRQRKQASRSGKAQS